MWLVIGSGCYDGWLLALYTLSVITMHTQISTYSWSPKYAFLNKKIPPQIFRWSDSISAILGFDIIWETRRQVKWPSNLSHNNQLLSYNPPKNTFEPTVWHKSLLYQSQSALLELLINFSSNFQTISFMFGELREPYIFFNFWANEQYVKINYWSSLFQPHCSALRHWGKTTNF